MNRQSPSFPRPVVELFTRAWSKNAKVLKSIDILDMEVSFRPDWGIVQGGFKMASSADNKAAREAKAKAGRASRVTRSPRSPRVARAARPTRPKRA
jgi:hypothetical protein